MEDPNEISEELRRLGVHKFRFDNEFKLHIEGDLDLSGKGLLKIPFQIESASFINLTGNEIDTFENFPIKAKTVILSYNKIKDFSTFPSTSNVDFLILDNNQLCSFKGSPLSVTNLSVENNFYMTTILGAPFCRGKLYAEETSIPLEEIYLHEVFCKAKTWKKNLSMLDNMKKFLSLSGDSHKLVSHTNFFSENLESLKLILTAKKFGI